MARQEQSPLLALTSSALLLPAYSAPTAADAPPEAMEAGVRYSRYSEDDLSSSSVIFGATERYEIDVVQAHLLAPVADNWAFALDVQTDHMSGASPWFVGQTGDGEPGVIMSGASISDNRLQVDVTTRYYFMRGNAGFRYSNSDEDDYESDAVALDVSVNSEDQSRTWSFAVSASDDDIRPTQGVIPVDVERASKDSRSAWMGVSQIVSRTALMRFGLSYTRHGGYLTDPYKLNDQRPEGRDQWVINAGWRQYLTGPNAAVHLDYRYFSDDWGIDSHTARLEWHQEMGRHALVPYVRYYSQSEADFFSVIADRSEDFYADDYRLSSFGALTVGARWHLRLNDWELTLQGERYLSDEGWGLFDGEEAPALVDFWRFTVGFNYKHY